MRGVEERVKYGVKEELSEVVDGVGHKGGDAEVVGAGLTFAKAEGVEIDAGQEKKRVLVVRSKLVLGLGKSVWTR